MLTLFSAIPFPYKLGAALLLAVSLYGYGYQKGHNKAKVEIAQFQAEASKKITELEKKNSEIKERVVIKYIDKVQTVKEKEYVYLKQAETVVPSQHDMSSGWVYLHDSSASARDADPTRSADETTSGIRDNQALGVIVSNYARCIQNTNQLSALQQWIIDNQQSVDSINAENSKKRKK